MEVTAKENAETDPFLRAALERYFTIVGEAARGLSAEFCAAHPEIPWAQLIAERNILVHNYRGVEAEKVWKMALRSVPRLIEQLEPLVTNPPSTSD